MVLVIFILSLMFVSSWQQEITEKSLNQMLDQLIEETVLSTYSNENENHSKIIYIKQGNLTRRSHDSRLNSFNTVHSSEFEDLQDLVNQIENSKHIANNNLNHVSSEVGSERTVQIERTGSHNQANDGDDMQDMDIINNEIFKTGRPEEPNNKIIVLTSDPESNLIHKYPEIIIDKISYDVTENINKPKLEKVETVVPTVKHLTNEEKKQVAVKTLNSLMKIILKGTQMVKKLDASKEKELDEMSNMRRSTQINNAYHNHNDVPVPYSELLPSGKMSLGKLPEGHMDLHNIINRPRSAYLDPALQLSRWGGNAGQNPVMSILRTHNIVHNRNSVHFIPKTFNISPRIVYKPLFRRKYH